MIQLNKGLWQNEAGQDLSADLVEASLKKLEDHFQKQNPSLAQFVLQGLLELVEGEQDVILDSEKWKQLSAEEIEFLTEHLEDVLQDLADNRASLAETVEEIQELVAEHRDLEETYMEGMGALDGASSEQLNQLSQQLSTIQTLTDDVEDMLKERQRLEDDIKQLLGQLSILLKQALGTD